jgi:hypothetical protein
MPNTKWGWWTGSKDRAPEFKPQYHQKKTFSFSLLEFEAPVECRRITWEAGRNTNLELWKEIWDYNRY